ncbi:hypothetical protein C4573_06715 [Candidatus Woesearchaeota archaeon]|nr:MAG: hypothetical protein C4573_06715 [Candidatus Woesearchaeota archaeon]
MDFEIKTKTRVNLKKYTQDDIDVAYKFSTVIYKEFDKFVKAIVLFGSSARQQKSGDIDILLIVDDVTIQLTPELIQTYRIITEKTVAKISTKLHITTMRFTSFWEYCRAGDPVAVNILRDGIAILDTGFFDPMQALLYQGRIRPTPESIWSYFSKAPVTLHNSQWHVLQGVIDLYWAVIDSAHAALMKMGEIPPSPAHVADLLEEKLVKKKLLHNRYPKIMAHFYHLSKAITHGEIRTISGEQYDQYFKDAKDFVDEMQRFIRK